MQEVLIKLSLSSDGEDFVADSVILTIPPSDSEKCMDILITDDNLAIEGNENFEVALKVPEGVISVSPNISRVTIINNDGN